MCKPYQLEFSDRQGALLRVCGVFELIMRCNYTEVAFTLRPLIKQLLL